MLCIGYAPLGGRGGVSPTLKRLIDRLKHCLSLGRHIVVPESQNAIALCFQPLCPNRIRCDPAFASVLRAIDFNDEAPVHAREIRNVRPNHNLSPEVTAFDFEPSQVSPQDRFCLCCVRA
jgi:hypothetical protein